MESFTFFPLKHIIVFHVILLFGLAGSNVIHPNFTASYVQFIDFSGTFLFSNNGTYKAAMYNPSNQQTNFYLCVIHSESNTIIWSANRNSPVSISGKMTLTSQGILISDGNGNTRWLTPELKPPVSSLYLTEVGNLVLSDQHNNTLWDSFSQPTDTIVIGQVLPVGIPLTSSVSNYDLSRSSYSLFVSESDSILQWSGFTYWELSMNINAFRNSNYDVEYLEVNSTGLYLVGHGGSVTIIQVSLQSADFRIAKMDVSGQFIVSSYSGSKWNHEFVGPDDKCGIPYICGRLGLCTDSSSSSNPICACPSNFHADPDKLHGCIPSSGSLSLPSACDNTTSNSSLTNSRTFSYLGLGPSVDYFANIFLDPADYGIDLSYCQNLCSKSCSCLGVFYKNASRSCLLIRNELGSVISRSEMGNGTLGYIKTEVKPSNTNPVGGKSSARKQIFLLVAVVVFPVTAIFLVLILGIILWRRWKLSRINVLKLPELNLPYSGELEDFTIPGLPVKYTYEELKAATEDFSMQIGCGGFGAVYKGTLVDQSIVAVKKITNLGLRGNREFCTEIAIIGNVHHTNLVKLKGFCAQGRERLLVYEYMNRGSLDRVLFGSGPVLEWQERFNIALGTARGLAYLHSGCDQKIIHCDVKPENILLHNHFMAKIADFGLSKLLSPEQSSHFTTMRGTRGYLAPEWLTSSAISDKTDVYSYGMVLLELVSGRKNCSAQILSHSLDNNNHNDRDIKGDNTPSSSSSRPGSIYFPMMALEMHEQGRYLELADPRVEGRVTSEEVEKLVKISLCCVHEEPSLRPSMLSVVGMLEGKIHLGQPRLESLSFLKFYGRRFAEASTLAGGDEPSGSLVYPQASSTNNHTGSECHSSMSCLSSQQISGPR